MYRNVLKGASMLFYILYNLFFPLAFLFFLPGLLVKLIRRPGIKRSYPERFSIFRFLRFSVLRDKV